MQLPRVIIAAVFFVIGLLIAVPALLRTMSGSSNAAESPSPTGSPSGAAPSATATSPGGTASPSPAPTGRPTPAQPLRVTIGRVDCPSRTVVVTVRNRGDAVQDYTVETDDGAAPKGDRIDAGQSRTTRLTLREDRRTRITVTWRNEPVEQATRTANCRRTASSSPEPEELPHTGPGDGVLWARAATGVAAMITGAIIVWYGGIWPRRRERIFDKG